MMVKGNFTLLLSTVLQGLTTLTKLPLKLVENTDKTTSLISRAGYPYETHSTQTTDGYILKLHRIPQPIGRPAVLVMHGLLASSADWVVLGKGKAIGFLLWDAGFDVWLGNARGNTNSRQHVSLSPSNAAFWEFSWHEIGIYDLPAMIDYVLNVTNQRQLHYAGHSQGTTSFFVMASERPEYNSKIRCMHALAPVAFMGRVKNILARLSVQRLDELQRFFENLGVHELLPSSPLSIMITKIICNTNEQSYEGLCPNVLYFMGGYSPGQMNASYVPELVEIMPAGASTRQVIHYAQGIRSGRFCPYDYGTEKNLQIYGAAIPPDYQLYRVTAPVIMHYSDNDLMAHPADVKLLASKLGNRPTMILIEDPMFNHFDFTWGKNADVYVYKRIIEIMRRF